jgi:hypothetical protein
VALDRNLAYLEELYREKTSQLAEGCGGGMAGEVPACGRAHAAAQPLRPNPQLPRQRGTLGCIKALAAKTAQPLQETIRGTAFCPAYQWPYVPTPPFKTSQN